MSTSNEPTRPDATTENPGTLNKPLDSFENKTPKWLAVIHFLGGALILIGSFAAQPFLLTRNATAVQIHQYSGVLFAGQLLSGFLSFGVLFFIFHGLMNKVDSMLQKRRGMEQKFPKPQESAPSEVLEPVGQKVDSANPPVAAPPAERWTQFIMNGLILIALVASGLIYSFHLYSVIDSITPVFGWYLFSGSMLVGGWVGIFVLMIVIIGVKSMKYLYQSMRKNPRPQ